MSNVSQHERSKSGKEEWLTDPKIIKALGTFDLDPCAPINRPWNMANKHYTTMDDGLIQPWMGRTWLNPPYGRKTQIWIKTLAQYGNGIALIYARTETRIFFPHVWNFADAVFFFQKRLLFYNTDGTPCTNKKTGKIEYAGAPSCLIAYGKVNVSAIEKSGLSGKLIYL
jgi:hypothetical protein